MNRRGLSFAPLLAACIVSPAAADTVTCANGSRYTGVIAGETDTHLVLRVGGGAVLCYYTVPVSPFASARNMVH